MTGDRFVSILPHDMTARNDDGDVLLFSRADFVTTICEGKSCSVCGRSRHEAAFNDEYIVANRTLRVFGMPRKEDYAAERPADRLRQLHHPVPPILQC